MYVCVMFHAYFILNTFLNICSSYEFVAEAVDLVKEVGPFSQSEKELPCTMSFSLPWTVSS